jgi:hypothetical protein
MTFATGLTNGLTGTPNSTPATMLDTVMTTNATNRNATTGNSIILEGDKTEVTIGIAKKKVPVKKAVLNRMGLRDAAEEGHWKMIAMKIPMYDFVNDVASNKKQLRYRKNLITT